jgi:hypothetical protein
LQFGDHPIQLDGPLGRVHARVSGEALHVLRAKGVVPQDGTGLVEANRAMLETIVLMKHEAGEVEDDGSILVTRFDVEG